MNLDYEERIEILKNLINAKSYDYELLPNCKDKEMQHAYIVGLVRGLAIMIGLEDNLDSK